MLLKRRKGSKVICSSEIFLLVLSTFAIAFIIGQTNIVLGANNPVVTVVPTKTPHQPMPGQTFYNLDFGDGKGTIVKYVGEKDGVASGITSYGETKTWETVGNDAIQPADVSSALSIDTKNNWGKTFDLGGQKYAVADALQNPSSVPGLVGPDGKLSDIGGKALSDAGLNNAYIGPSGEVLFASQAPYKYNGFFGLVETGNFFYGNLFQGLEWSVAVVGVIQLLRLVPGIDAKLIDSLSIAAFAGIMGGKALYGLFGAGTPGQLGGQGVIGNFISPGLGIGIGVGIAAVTFVLLYKKKQQKVVNLQCLPWEAPLGGASCEKCNQDPLKPCSEYRCKSLGQACDLVNPGTSEERCVWVNPKDVASPTITPWKEVLTGGLDYRPDGVRPPALGSKIVRNDGGCIVPYTPLTFGIVTNEPSQCKIDYVHRNQTKAFDSMKYFFGESNFYSYNHTQSLRLPSLDAVDAVSDGSPELKNGAITNLFVRCRDANGNENVDEYVFTFCVDKSPDTTPPVIEGTSILSGSPVTSGTQDISVTAYVNEPSECKWSPQDKNYVDMENTFSCATQVYEQNAQQVYPCTTTLNGIKDNADNLFFFRCKDQPFKEDKDRNTNTQSYRFVLRGSQALSIINKGPTETITGSTDVLPVDLTLETDDGADNGKAICYFSSTGEENSFVSMFETNNYMHKQTLNLASGLYTYYFRCVDAGGNSDSTSVSFNVFLDRDAPKVTRVYKEGADALKLITNEDAECSYSTQNCNFNFADGKAMIYNSPGIKTILYAPWQDGNTYYIKCRDSYGNLPSPNSCSIIAGASNLH